MDLEKCLATVVELTERNQKLEDENKLLLLENEQLKHRSERKPELFIHFEADVPNDAEKEDLLYSRSDNMHTDDNDEVVYLKVGKVNTDVVREEY